MNDDEAETDEAEARVKLGQLILDHADLDAAVQALALAPMPDMMVIARLKRKKLALKDEIQRLKNELLPDILA